MQQSGARSLRQELSALRGNHAAFDPAVGGIKILTADLSSIQGMNLREKASYCRRLATTADAHLARALLELADEFEQAAFDGVGPVDAAPTDAKARKRL